MPLPRIEPERLARPGSLAADVLHGRPQAIGLFASAPSAHSQPRAARIAPEVLETTTPRAEAKLRRILAGDGVLVTTGQQPGLFLGPLYVVYKALTAVRAAEEIEATTSRPALAAFWIAADDHDWEEVAVARVPHGQDGIRPYALSPPKGHAGRSVGPAPLPDAVSEVLGEFAQSFINKEFTEDYLESLRDAYRPGVSFAHAFSAALRHVLRRWDVAVLDSSHPDLRGAARPLLRWALEHSAEVDQAVATSTAKAVKAGYTPQLRHVAGATGVFMDTGNARRRLHRDHNLIREGVDGPRTEARDLLRLLEAEPERFSPAAALRPVLEAWLLPGAAAVLGPGEIAYWAQLVDLFSLAEVPMPGIVARDSWRIVERSVDRILDKLDLTLSDLVDGAREASERLVAAGRPEATGEALQLLHTEVARGFEALEGAIDEELPGVRAAVGKARAGVGSALSAFEKTVDRAVRDQEDLRLRQLRRAAQHLYPDGKPQERVVNPYYYLARYGEPLVARLLEQGRFRQQGGVPTLPGTVAPG